MDGTYDQEVPLKHLISSAPSGTIFHSYDLSAWGILALTHHVLVQVTALRAGKPGFTAYAVLGDDIVIADDAVASEYLAIMARLGVSINLLKSLESCDFQELAKRWVGPKKRGSIYSYWPRFNPETNKK
jgi:hypothetical protein